MEVEKIFEKKIPIFEKKNSFGDLEKKKKCPSQENCFATLNFGGRFWLQKNTFLSDKLFFGFDTGFEQHTHTHTQTQK